MSEEGEAPRRAGRVRIRYCTRCRWLLRAGWLAQELLSTFADELEEVALAPSDVAGTFRVELDGAPLWDRRTDGGFPQARELKQRVRDAIAPGRDLGHLDR